MLDLTAYPHLLDVILEHADTPTLLMLSQTCRSLHARFPSHLIARRDGLTALDGQPLAGTPSTLSLLRVLDIHTTSPPVEGIHIVPVLRCAYGTPDAVWSPERIFFVRNNTEKAEYFTPARPVCRTVLSFHNAGDLEGELQGLYGRQLVFLFCTPPAARWSRGISILSRPPPDFARALKIIGDALAEAALAVLAPSCTVHRDEFWATFVGLGPAEGAGRRALKSGDRGDRGVRKYLCEHVRFLSLEAYKAEVGEVQFRLETVWSGD